MDKENLRNTLTSHLDTLRRNLEAVPLEVLKTTYQKPFQALCQNISLTVSAYVTQISLEGIRIRKDLVPEAASLIEAAMRQSGLRRQISTAAFRHQNISEIDSLALALRELVPKALLPLYNRHLGLYISSECLLNPSNKAPDLYNDANGCILQDGKWIPLTKAGTTIQPLVVNRNIPDHLVPSPATVRNTASKKEKQAPIQLSLFDMI